VLEHAWPTPRARGASTTKGIVLAEVMPGSPPRAQRTGCAAKGGGGAGLPPTWARDGGVAHNEAVQLEFERDGSNVLRAVHGVYACRGREVRGAVQGPAPLQQSPTPPPSKNVACMAYGRAPCDLSDRHQEPRLSR